MRSPTEIVGVVMREDDAIEEQCHDARQLHRLRESIAEITKQKQKGRLQLGKLIQRRMLVDEGRDQPKGDANKDRKDRHR